MATTTTGNIMTSGSLGEFIRREAIKNFERSLFFAMLGQNVQLPVGYNKYTFPTVDNKDGSAAALTEGTTPTEVGFNLTNVEVTLTQYGSFAILSDVVLTDSPVPAIQETAFELGRDLANKVDDTIQTTILAGTNVIYSGDATSRATIDSADTIKASDIAKAANLLKAKSAPKFEGDAYVAVVHPHVLHDLQIESGTGTFIDLNKYTSENAIRPLKGEIGMLYGVRILVSANAQILADAGATTTDVYPTFVMGRNAYGVVMSGGMETFIKGLGSAGSTDPLDQRATVGWKVRLGQAILKQDALYRIESASSLGAN